jgi:hypothetical protein
MSYEIKIKDIDTQVSGAILAIHVGYYAIAKLLLCDTCRLSISHIHIAVDGEVE